ncbi:UNVERIFIED_CONTAM: hypothetical protein GTU68_052397 [Idotea baltica]|nr:hypothetical protein [Idotea baltica]
MNLDPINLAESRKILREYGNMSSATILFILKEILEKKKSGRVCAMAFGPGLSVESSILSIGNNS